MTIPKRPAEPACVHDANGYHTWVHSDGRHEMTGLRAWRQYERNRADHESAVSNRAVAALIKLLNSIQELPTKNLKEWGVEAELNNLAVAEREATEALNEIEESGWTR